MSNTLPITVHIATDIGIGITNAPYWFIIDPERFKKDVVLQ